MIPLTPESWGTESDRQLREFNTCHDPGSGRFCSGKGGPVGPKPEKGPKPQYLPHVTEKGVIQARTVEEAVEHILAGRDVELASKRHINTVLSKLAEMANDAKAKGQDAPNYNLCRVSVKGTNVFCASGFKSKQYPQGIPRIEMPQMGGMPVPGSRADKLQRHPETGEVDGAEDFVNHLTSEKGIKVRNRRLPAASLKASQAELVGPKVAGMMTASTYDPGKKPIFVSRDGYVIDGHHRWAAVVGRDAADGRLGGTKMNVIQVDAPISRILRIANSWAGRFGIAPAAGPNAKKRA